MIDIYQQGGFANLALRREEGLRRRATASTASSAAPTPKAGRRAQPLVKTHLAELARHHHAAAQDSKASADSPEAVRWYRVYLAAFPNDPDAAQNNFLLAELLFEDQRFAEAAVEYEKVGLRLPGACASSADAGYAALLAYAAQEKRATAPPTLPALQRSGVDSALRFAEAFGSDPRAAHGADRRRREAVRAARYRTRQRGRPAGAGADAAGHAGATPRGLDGGRAHRVRRRQLRCCRARLRRGAGLAAGAGRGRADIVERLAASVYKQGEQARAAGHAREAVGHFDRVATVAPQSAVRATAQYDAAAALIGLKDWDGAASDARRLPPALSRRMRLQGEVGSKLTLAYLEQGQWAPAAAEFERVAAGQADSKLAAASFWQAAELYDKGGPARCQRRGHRPTTVTWRVSRNRWNRPSKRAGAWPGSPRPTADATREFALMQRHLPAPTRAAATRAPTRTRYLGATASLALAEPAFEAYRKVPLVEPLARQLKLKKARLEEVLKAYAVAADYGVAEVSTAATFHIAALYQDFGKALMSSQRPKKLSKAELEQYNVMLEEQAYPVRGEGDRAARDQRPPRAAMVCTTSG